MPDLADHPPFRQHLDLIYAAARRQLPGDPAGADDVAQAVFLIALRKARQRQLPKERFMAGWLLRVTHYTVKAARRAAARRAFHERHALPESTSAPAEAADEAALRAALDEAMLSLRPADREVVARRYLQGQPVRAMAAALDVPENTLSRRIHRALDKLRHILTRRGVSVPAAALVAFLAVESSLKAPAALAAALPPAAGPSVLANTVLRRMLMTKSLAVVSIAAAIAASCAAAIWLPSKLVPPAHAQTLIAAPASASAPVTPPTDAERLARAWDDLDKPEPAAARAVLALAAMPGQTATLARGRIVPVQIDAAEVRKQIALLASDDEKTWQQAYLKLTYQDPRLAIDLQTLFDEAPEGVARDRLAALLSDTDVDQAGRITGVTLQKLRTNYDFFGIDSQGRRNSWLARDKDSQLTNDRETVKRQWLRVDRALAILAGGGSADGLKIVNAVAGGDEQAEPTKAAKAILARIAGAATRPDTPAARQAEMDSDWNDLLQVGPSAMDALLRFAARPGDTVAFLKPRLLPLTATPEELRGWIGGLAGDAAEQTSAYDKLAYFDPRLALTIQEVFAAAPDITQRMRLVEVLNDWPAGTVNRPVNFQLHTNRGRMLLTDDQQPAGTYMLAVNLSELERPDGRSMAKQQWRRANRAIVLLGAIDTPDSLVILRAMAGGNGDASPTQVAREELARLEKK